MKIFYAYLLICFFAGIFLANRRRVWRNAILLALGLIVCIAYYFFRKV